MSEATVTSKGQLTIPADVRRRKALTAGKRVVFTELEDGTTVMRPKTKSILDLKGILRGRKRTRAVPIEDMSISRR